MAKDCKIMRYVKDNDGQTKIQPVNKPTREVVPGDIIKLDQGNKIPCDCMLIEGEDIEGN